jgi:hypothetical protein
MLHSEKVYKMLMFQIQCEVLCCFQIELLRLPTLHLTKTDMSFFEDEYLYKITVLWEYEFYERGTEYF